MDTYSCDVSLGKDRKIAIMCDVRLCTIVPICHCVQLCLFVPCVMCASVCDACLCDVHLCGMCTSVGCVPVCDVCLCVQSQPPLYGHQVLIGLEVQAQTR